MPDSERPLTCLVHMRPAHPKQNQVGPSLKNVVRQTASRRDANSQFASLSSQALT